MTLPTSITIKSDERLSALHRKIFIGHSYRKKNGLNTKTATPDKHSNMYKLIEIEYPHHELQHNDMQTLLITMMMVFHEVR